jgi:hypothetical protein
VPSEVYERLLVPSLAKLKFRHVEQNDTSLPNRINASNREIKKLENLRHLQLQVDHVDDTDFVQVKIKRLFQTIFAAVFHLLPFFKSYRL